MNLVLNLTINEIDEDIVDLDTQREDKYDYLMTYSIIYSNSEINRKDLESLLKIKFVL